MIKVAIFDTFIPEAQAILTEQVNSVLKDMFDDEMYMYSFGFLKGTDTLATDEKFGEYETKCFRGVKSDLTGLQKAQYFHQTYELVRDSEEHYLPPIGQFICLNLARYFKNRYTNAENHGHKTLDPLVMEQFQAHEFLNLNYDECLVMKRVKIFPADTRELLRRLITEERSTSEPWEIESMIQGYEHIDRFYDTLKCCFHLG